MYQSRGELEPMSATQNVVSWTAFEFEFHVMLDALTTADAGP
jgi:hypothetical protein